jgi:hypothetical protein
VSHLLLPFQLHGFLCRVAWLQHTQNIVLIIIILRQLLSLIIRPLVLYIPIQLHPDFIMDTITITIAIMVIIVDITKFITIS